MPNGAVPPPAAPLPPQGQVPQLPGILTPIVQVVAWLGLPTVFAGVLLYFVLFQVSATMELIQQSETDRVRILSAMQDTLIAALDRQADRFEKAINDQTGRFEQTINGNIQANRELAQQYRSSKGAQE